MAKAAILLLIAWANPTVSQAQRAEIVLSEWAQEPTSEKSPLILLDFWATWCGPCHAVQPHLKQLQDRSGGKMKVIQISQEPLFTVQTFLEEHAPLHPVAIDADGITHDLYDVKSLPYAVLMDYNRQILWQGSPADLKFHQLDRLVSSYSHDKNAWSLLEFRKPKEQASKNPMRYVTNPVLGGVSYTPTEIQGQPMTEDSSFFNLYGTVHSMVQQLNTITDDSLTYISDCESSNEYWELHLPKGYLIEAWDWFLSLEGYEVVRDMVTEEYIEITAVDPQKLWSAEVLDYGPGFFIASEYGVEIDNASLARMCEIVTESSAFRLDCSKIEYNTIHDWSIYYNDEEGFMAQLKDELGFGIRKGTMSQRARIIRCHP